MSEAIFAYTSTERHFRSLIVRCESRKKAQNLLGNIEAREAVSESEVMRSSKLRAELAWSGRRGAACARSAGNWLAHIVQIHCNGRCSGNNFIQENTTTECIREKSNGRNIYPTPNIVNSLQLAAAAVLDNVSNPILFPHPVSHHN